MSKFVSNFDPLKVTRVAVTRQDGCLGITVRGGAPQPLVITSVHPGGPADR